MAKRRKYPKNIVKDPVTITANPIVPQNNISSIFKNTYVQLLIVITIIGCFLRLYNLGTSSLWLDEASTVTFATAGSFWDIWNLTATVEPNPPLFHWVEYIMLSFGNNEFILRFIPAILGTLTIPIMYFIGKEFIDENGGIIAATLCAISPFFIIYSQEARAYTMLLFFIALTTMFYLKALKDNKHTYWILFAISGSLAFWTHFYAAIVIGSLILYTLVMYKMKYAKELTISSGILAITTLPLAAIAIPVIISTKSGGPTFGVQGFGIIVETIVQLTGFNSLVTSVMLLLFICGITTLFIKERNKSILIIWVLITTFAISLYLSYKIPMVPRYLIFLNIFLILGISASYKLFSLLTQKPTEITCILILLIVILNTPVLMGYYSSSQKDDWRGFSKTLSGMTQPGDLIVTVPGYMDQPLNYYYSNKTDGTIEYRASNASVLESVRKLQTGNTYYIITWDIQSADPSGNALKWINTNTKQVYQIGGINVFKS